MNPISPPVSDTDPEIVGELTTTVPLSNPERYAKFILKRDEVPFCRVWDKGERHVQNAA